MKQWTVEIICKNGDYIGMKFETKKQALEHIEAQYLTLTKKEVENEIYQYLLSNKTTKEFYNVICLNYDTNELKIVNLTQ